MSHSKERSEKQCLNCGAHLSGRYCHICGQENLEPKETVWGLVSHFFNDITHFDGKFFSTVKYLIIRPGFLSAEYIKGRRASYLHPIRMYVFTSAFFFIIFFSIFNPEQFLRGNLTTEERLAELREASTSIKEKLPETTNTDLKAAMQRTVAKLDVHAAALQATLDKDEENRIKKLNTAKAVLDSSRSDLDDMPASARVILDSSLKQVKAQKKDRNTLNIGNFNKELYASKMAYDSVQHELPPDKQDGWFKHSILSKLIIYKTKYKNDGKEAGAILLENFFHLLPRALFVSLPVFALILLILYARRNFYYVDHGIFSIHFYCASFIILLMVFAVDKIITSTGWTGLTIIKVLLVLAIFFYLYKAMRRFYKQRRAKTIIKFLILNFFLMIVLTTLAVLFFLLSLMQFS